MKVWKIHPYGLATAAALLIGLPAVATAQVVITEIGAYERTDHEWVEIYNVSGAAVDLTGWKFWENNTNHGLAALAGDLSLAPGEYGIIAQKGDVFLTDHPGFGGTVLDSSWSTLKESGEEIGLKDTGGNFVERFTYLPAPETSLQRRDPNLADYSSANWQPHPSGSTPGAANSNASAAAGPPPSAADASPQPSPNAPPDPPPPPPPRYGRHVVINEFVADPAPGKEEWVELYNAGALPAKLEDWKLMEGAGAKRTLTGELPAGGFLVVRPVGSLNDDGDHLLLLDNTNVVVDEVSYGDFNDGQARDNAPTAAAGEAVARSPDGVSGGSDAADFRVTTTPTPGQSNQITAPTPVATPAPPAPSPLPTPPPPTPSPPLTVVPAPRVSPTPTLTPTPQPTPPAAARRQPTPTRSPRPTPAVTPTPRPSPTASPTPRPTPGRVLGVERASSVAAALAAPPGARLTIVGTVIAMPGQLGRQIFYLADDTGGIQIYHYRGEFPPLALGDLVEAAGERTVARGEPRLKVKAATAVTGLESGPPLEATAVTVADLTATSSGTLVRLDGEVTDVSTAGFTFDDGSGEITVNLGSTAEIIPHVGSRGWVQGIVVSRDDAWRLKPRQPQDLKLAPPTVASPLTAQPTVDRRWYGPATAFAVSLGGSLWLWRHGRKKPAPPGGP